MEKYIFLPFIILGAFFLISLKFNKLFDFWVKIIFDYLNLKDAKRLAKYQLWFAGILFLTIGIIISVYEFLL